MKTLTTLLLTFCLVLSLNAQGIVEAINDYSSPSTSQGDGTIGYTFRATDSLTVTDIGVFAYIVSQTSPMRVGLWDSSGNLLADRLISTTSPLIGTARYEGLENPISLQAQQVYHIGASYVSTPSVFSYNLAGGDFFGHATPSLGVELIGYASNPTGFAFPAAVSGGEGVVALTANFRYPAIPEPATASLVLLAALALVAARSRGTR
jgi:hypothetical protein